MAHQVPLKNVKISGGVTFQVSEDLVCSCVIHSSCRVFKGTFEGESVAVKKLPFNCTDYIGPQDEQHWAKLIKLIDDHDHVVQYRLHGVQDNIRYDFQVQSVSFNLQLCVFIRYLVMQLCQGSLLDYCRGTLNESVASHVKATDVMWQIICGVDYLHCQKVDYGDLELKNVLFWKNDPKSRRVVVKLAGSYGCNKVLIY
jgi:serine/threonine protein kinase